MIKLFAMDVDGTLTDGGVYMDGRGGEFKRYDVQDGLGLHLLKQAGIERLMISGRYSASTAQRAENLGIERCVNGISDKLSYLKNLAVDLEITPEEIAFVGDDIPDLACMEWVGLPIAVANARSEILQIARWTTPSRGGNGAVRDAAEYVIQLNRKEAAAH